MKKKIITLSLITAALVLLPGCGFNGIFGLDKIVREVGKSDSSLIVEVPTPWGPAKVMRSNPSTNSLPTSLNSKEGKIDVTR